MTTGNWSGAPESALWVATQESLRARPRIWLVTGAGGFIGSHLVAKLLELGQRVIALDNFSTGKLENILAVRSGAGECARLLHLRVGDIRDLDDCRAVMRFEDSTVDVVLHQAAIGSVPRSIDRPLETHAANVTGFVNMLQAAREAGVGSFVYASSSAVYGDHPSLPKVEGTEGTLLSPYALSKWIDEEYAANFAMVYGFSSIGLRYFNVFGARQDPNGPYAAVIPRWIDAQVQKRRCVINGDGETSRDFCHVDNVVQANLLAATTTDRAALDQVYNIAVGKRTTLNQLHDMLRDGIAQSLPEIAQLTPEYAPFRAGDVRHSLADIDKARRLLGYVPHVTVEDGLRRTIADYLSVRA